MEIRIKEYQINMFGNRVSCSAWSAKKFHMLLSAVSSVYMNELRHILDKDDQSMP